MQVQRVAGTVVLYDVVPYWVPIDTEPTASGFQYCPSKWHGCRGCRGDLFGVIYTWLEQRIQQVTLFRSFRYIARFPLYKSPIATTNLSHSSATSGIMSRPSSPKHVFNASTVAKADECIGKDLVWSGAAVAELPNSAGRGGVEWSGGPRGRVIWCYSDRCTSAACSLVAVGAGRTGRSRGLGFTEPEEVDDRALVLPLLREDLAARGVEGDHFGPRPGEIVPSVGGEPKLTNMLNLTMLVQNVNDKLGGSFATVELPPVQMARTRAEQCHHGVIAWNECLRVYTANRVSTVDITITSGHHSRPQGRANIPATDILLKRHLEGWFTIDGFFKSIGKIHVIVDFEPADENPLWGNGVGENFPGVPHTFFPQHRACLVTPYQNSHIEDDFIPPIAMQGGKHRIPGKYWKELHHAICSAKKFVYIAGWSMFAKISLVRSPDGELGETLGELLIRRAQEGIRVNVMIWDDKTSNLHSMLKSFREGIMHTHDEDTEKFFTNTDVACLKCPRDPRADAFHLAEGFVFTHHQKVVVVDAPALPPYSPEQRRIIAFVGGIDLCGGRYDTPSHSLFRTLTTVHRKDFQQGCIPGAALKSGGPRQPWHDIHSKLEGAVAWDAHTNFVQRWLCQAGKINEHLLVSVDPEASEFCPPSPAVEEHHPAAWNVQLLRSIDTTSVVGFPDDSSAELVLEKGLVREEKDLVDRSIQDAYICAIRRAKHFLFIENQYFIGSSYGWKDLPDWHTAAPHLIPMEIALKIVSKIRAGEHFCCYVIVPMMPDGAPDGPSVQDILHHVKETMQMMYQMIGDALREVGRLSCRPTDYLCLFCLGNREVKEGHELIPDDPPQEGTHYWLSQENRRFEIYCHAKLMIGKRSPALPAFAPPP
ncbi:hypothetical protein AXG93_2507s1170 [Marchantia polymorpha subsp. ruderalis]|uniref:phospholipase D n=1 Tax=Marchantia polymorpha subsp. ruderalis TaxID=1480154 RepID=A0A176W7D8_MARPO|nr:hypothetical protein AXG93_2507s1170 [Marchantia polymorpha subsp. ruderalis]